MGIFPVEFNIHLIRPLLTVLPNSTFHEHYSTVSSIFRELFLLLHCADRYNGFYSMDYVTECVFVQAGSRFSLPPNVMLSYMRGNLELMLKIYIFHHKWTKIFRRTITFHIWAQWQKESSVIQAVCSSDWALLSSLHGCSKTAFLGTEQSLQRKGLGSLSQRKQQFAPSLTWLGNGFNNKYKAKEGKELPFNVHDL